MVFHGRFPLLTPKTNWALFLLLAWVGDQFDLSGGNVLVDRVCVAQLHCAEDGNDVFVA